jgi:hypothetical protein
MCDGGLAQVTLSGVEPNLQTHVTAFLPEELSLGGEPIVGDERQRLGALEARHVRKGPLLGVAIPGADRRMAKARQAAPSFA